MSTSLFFYEDHKKEIHLQTFWQCKQCLHFSPQIFYQTTFFYQFDTLNLSEQSVLFMERDKNQITRNKKI